MDLKDGDIASAVIGALAAAVLSVITWVLRSVVATVSGIRADRQRQLLTERYARRISGWRSQPEDGPLPLPRAPNRHPRRAAHLGFFVLGAIVAVMVMLVIT